MSLLRAVDTVEQLVQGVSMIVAMLQLISVSFCPTFLVETARLSWI
jgi:hypothetical protein